MQKLIWISYFKYRLGTQGTEQILNLESSVATDCQLQATTPSQCKTSKDLEEIPVYHEDVRENYKAVNFFPLKFASVMRMTANIGENAKWLDRNNGKRAPAISVVAEPSRNANSGPQRG